MRSRSSALGSIAVVALIGVIVIPLPKLPSIAQASQVIVQADVVQPEDLYAFGQDVTIEGVVQGDLIVIGGDLDIRGTVEGDVLAALWGRARIEGEVGGSVRVAAPQVDTNGVIGDDLALAAGTARIKGKVGRDVLLTAGWVDLDATIGRNVRGQVRDLDLNGTVERNIDVAVVSIDVGPNAEVRGDLSYRSSHEADVEVGAVVDGQLIQRMTSTPLELRAFKRVAGIIGLLAFLFAGIVLAWALRRTSYRSAAVIVRRPWLTLGVGIGAFIVAPLAIVLLGVTLVGIPIAAILLALVVLALFLGPIPAVTAIGARLTRGHGGIFGAFLAGALIWRFAVWVLPIVGTWLYFVAVVWGTGAWLLGALEARREFRPPTSGMFARRSARSFDPPEGWEPPLPPLNEAPTAGV